MSNMGGSLGALGAGVNICIFLHVGLMDRRRPMCGVAVFFPLWYVSLLGLIMGLTL